MAADNASAWAISATSIYCMGTVCAPAAQRNFCAEIRLIDQNDSNDSGPTKCPATCSPMAGRFVLKRWTEDLGIIPDFQRKPQHLVLSDDFYTKYAWHSIQRDVKMKQPPKVAHPAVISENCA